MTVITREQWVVLLHKKLISGGYGCKKTVKNGDKFHCDKRQEQQVNDIKVGLPFFNLGFIVPIISISLPSFMRFQFLDVSSCFSYPFSVSFVRGYHLRHQPP